MKIEHVDGFIRLENDNQQAIWISEADGWQLYEEMYQLRDILYRAANRPMSSNPHGGANPADLLEARDEIATWKEVIAEEREQADEGMRHAAMITERALRREREQARNPWQAAADHIHRHGDKNIYGGRDE